MRRVPSSLLASSLLSSSLLTVLLPAIAAATMNAWEDVGPANHGGSVSALVIHPTNPAIMYAGALGGGVFKSEDGAESWRPVGDALPNLQVASLALDPSNPETIYAGTGDIFGGGAGIFISKDGGASWSQLPATATDSDLLAPFQAVLRIALSPTQQERIYAAAYDGLYRSTDGGENWTRVLVTQETTFSRACTDLVVTTEGSADRVLASCGVNPGIVSRSTDGGETWTTVLAPEGAGRVSIAVAPSDHEFVYALASDSSGNYLGVFRSGDGGTTWEVINQANTHCQLASLFAGWGGLTGAVAVDPLDRNRVWVSGHSLFRSEDGGQTWAKFDDDLNIHRRAIAFPSDFDGVAADQAFVGGRNGIARANARTALDPYDCTTGQGPMEGWTFSNTGFAAARLLDGDVSAHGSKILAATDGQGWAFGALDQAASVWRTQGETYPTAVALDPVHTDTWIVGGGSSVFKSIDAGASFYHKTSELSGWVDFLGMDPNDPQVLWVGGDQLWRSSDQGETWSVASPIWGSGFGPLAVAPGNSNAVIVAHGSQIHRTGSALSTGDTGTEWISSTVEFMHPNNLVFDPTDPSIVYATVEIMRPHLWRSADGGATWAALDLDGRDHGLPGLRVRALVVDPTNPSRIYVGTDAGLFTSVDGGASWAIDASGLPRTWIHDLVVRTTAEGTFLFAFTGGRGVFRRMIAAPSLDPVPKKRRNGGGMPLWLLATMAALAATRRVVGRRVSGSR